MDIFNYDRELFMNLSDEESLKTVQKILNQARKTLAQNPGKPGYSALVNLCDKLQKSIDDFDKALFALELQKLKDILADKQMDAMFVDLEEKYKNMKRILHEEIKKGKGDTKGLEKMLDEINKIEESYGYKL